MIRAVLVVATGWVVLAAAAACALGALIRHADRRSTSTAATPPVLSVVTVERDDNVTYLQWHSTAPRPLPVRLSPRPALTLANRVASSQAAADLRDTSFVIGLLLAALICLAWFDPTAQDLAHLSNGGPR